MSCPEVVELPAGDVKLGPEVEPGDVEVEGALAMVQALELGVVIRCELGVGHRLMPGPRAHRATVYGTANDESVAVHITWATPR